MYAVELSKGSLQRSEAFGIDVLRSRGEGEPGPLLLDLRRVPAIRTGDGGVARLYREPCSAPVARDHAQLDERTHFGQSTKTVGATADRGQPWDAGGVAMELSVRPEVRRTTMRDAIASPDDLDLRLRLADAIEEEDPDMAAFIRNGVALARLPPHD